MKKSFNVSIELDDDQIELIEITNKFDYLDKIEKEYNKNNFLDILYSLEKNSIITIIDAAAEVYLTSFGYKLLLQIQNYEST